MLPKEKPLAWVGMFMLLKGSPRPQLAHAYVDAWSSAESGKWLEDNYGYGHANLLAKPSSSDLVRALKIDDPKAVADRRTRTSTATSRGAISTRRSGKRREGRVRSTAGKRRDDRDRIRNAAGAPRDAGGSDST